MECARFDRLDILPLNEEVGVCFLVNGTNLSEAFTKMFQDAYFPIDYLRPTWGSAFKPGLLNTTRRRLLLTDWEGESGCGYAAVDVTYDARQVMWSNFGDDRGGNLLPVIGPFAFVLDEYQIVFERLRELYLAGDREPSSHTYLPIPEPVDELGEVRIEIRILEDRLHALHCNTYQTQLHAGDRIEVRHPAVDRFMRERKLGKYQKQSLANGEDLLELQDRLSALERVCSEFYGTFFRN